MRYGFTTGSCAAAAAKGLDICRSEPEVRGGVEKDGGDDPDITTGAKIYAKVSYLKGKEKEQEIVIEGGIGVGRVTRPGLDQPVGSAAINRVPREMIKREVLEVCRAVDYEGSLLIEISVPKGEELCQRLIPDLALWEVFLFWGQAASLNL